MKRISAGGVVGLSVVLLGGCGSGGSGGEPNPPPLVVAKTSGDQQTGQAGVALANDLRVSVTRDGAPQAGVTVTWSAGAGSVDPASAPSGTDGISATAWTLGAAAGAQTAQAAVSGATGSPVTFNATATANPPPPPPNAVSVTVGNFFFQSVRNGTMDPAVDTVAVNGTVTWTWSGTGTEQHSIESTGMPSFTSSGTLTGNGQTYNFQFTQAGTYTYDCGVHKSLMTGRIVVR